MRRYISLLLVGFLSLPAFGCAAEDSSIPSSRELKKHVRKLASKQFEGRLVGTEGLELAVDYTIDVFKDYGVKPGGVDDDGQPTFRQIVPMTQEVYGPDCGLIITKDGKERKLEWGKDCLFSYKGLETGDYPTNPIPVWGGYAIHEPEYGWDDFEGLDLNDRWVLQMRGVPEGDNRLPADLESTYQSNLGGLRKRIEYFEEAGIKAVMEFPREESERSWNAQIWLRTLTGTRLAGDPPHSYRIDFPFVGIRQKWVEWVFAGTPYNPLTHNGTYWTGELEDVRMEIVVDVTMRDLVATNVIARVNGTDPDLAEEVIVVSAHLDHIGIIGGEMHPGATDNAGGCAVVLGVAKAIAEAPVRRPVLFVLFTGEEVGLLGSRYFVANPPLPLDHFKLDLQVDMVGMPAEEPEGDIYAFFPAHYMKDFSRVDSSYEELDMILTDFDSWGHRVGSDQDSFLEQGVDGVFIGTGMFPQYHTPEDRPIIVDGKLLHHLTEMVYAMVCDFGNRDSLPSTN